MVDSVHISLLLDIYGQLLTERTRYVMELYYGEDMSLSEIAQNEHISRQGVHDALKRGVASLYEYEDKLGVLDRFLKHQNAVNEALDALHKCDATRAERILIELSKTL